MTTKLEDQLANCVRLAMDIIETNDPQQALWLAIARKTLLDYVDQQVAESGKTHSAECWRWHLDCAVAQIESAPVVMMHADRGGYSQSALDSDAIMALDGKRVALVRVE